MTWTRGFPSKEAKRPSHGYHKIYSLDHQPTTNHSHNACGNGIITNLAPLTTCTWSCKCWMLVLMKQDNLSRHGILQKPSASIKFGPKFFHKSSVIFDIFAKQIMRDFRHFWHGKLSFQGIQTNWIQDSVADHFKAFTALFSPCTLCNKNHFTFSFVENLKPFFVRSVKFTL